jgi:hypothetical protein
MQVNDINLVIHISMGTVGLVCGLLPLLSAKGGRIHRRSGRVFVILAGIVLGTAILADLFLKEPTALLVATLSATYQYVGSLRALMLRTRAPSMVDAWLVCAALGGCAWIVLSKSPSTTSWSPMVGYSAAAYVACIALYDLSRNLWATYWLKHARTIDHGLKMTGCYFAMLSSGAGNSLRHLQPWSQVVPSTLGILVMATMLVMYATRRASVPSMV